MVLTGIAEPDGEPGHRAHDDPGLRHDDERGHEGQERAEEKDQAQLAPTRPVDVQDVVDV